MQMQYLNCKTKESFTQLDNKYYPSRQLGDEIKPVVLVFLANFSLLCA